MIGKQIQAKIIIEEVLGKEVKNKIEGEFPTLIAVIRNALNQDSQNEEKIRKELKDTFWNKKKTDITQDKVIDFCKKIIRETSSKKEQDLDGFLKLPEKEQKIEERIRSHSLNPSKEQEQGEKRGRSNTFFFWKGKNPNPEVKPQSSKKAKEIGGRNSSSSNDY